MKKISLLLFILFPSLGFSQGEANIWYFGFQAGIDFNSGAAVAIQGPINTNEGCATICNQAGNILFSTDGITVYNAINNVMVIGLWGDPSSTQSAVIVPLPGDSLKYYIFTTAAQANPNGFAYSVVDMSMNGGLGGILSQNTQLLTPTCEKITAVRHANGTDVWVITHKFGNAEFYAYLVTSAGVSAPVITSIGMPVTNTLNTIGYLKCSPDGHKLASARDQIANHPIEVFDFNNATGMLSNYLAVPSAGFAYGVSFSPDNSKLYVSYEYNTTVKLQQFDLSITNWQNFPYPLLTDDLSGYYGALQLAPDGKIYFARTGQPALSVINNPNAAGAACNFVLNGFPLYPGKLAFFGLPNFIDYNVTFTCNVHLGPDIYACDSFTYVLDAGPGAASYLWQDGSTNQTLTATYIGQYYVIKTMPDSCISSDTMNVFLSTATPIDLGSDTIFCNTVGLLLDAGNAYANYTWQNNTHAQTLYAATPGTFIVTGSNAFSCAASDTIHIGLSAPSLQIGSDITICNGDSLVLSGGNNFSSYIWSTGDTTTSITVTAAGYYSLTVLDSSGCDATDGLLLNITSPQVSIGSDTAFCNSVNLILNATPGFTSYVWENNANGSSHPAQSAGTYFVHATDQFGCIASDTALIGVYNPFVDLGEDTMLCDRATMILNAGNFNSYLWQDGSTENTLSVSYPGIYYVSVMDAHNCFASDTIEISSINCDGFYVPNAFSPNGDGSNDVFHILNPDNIHLASLQIFNRWGQLIFETSDANAGWNGTYKSVPCEVDVYVFVIQGNNPVGDPVFMKGNVSLIR